MNRIDILVPDLPESVADATVVIWHKKPGENVQRNEILVEIETDKVILEVPAPATGVLEALLEDKGATVISRQILGYLSLEENDTQSTDDKSSITNQQNININLNDKEINTLSPTTRRLVNKHNLNPDNITGSGVGKRITREDVKKHLVEQKTNLSTNYNIKSEFNIESSKPKERIEKRVPMTRLRKRIAERLLKVKNNTAMLTTFNEVNMQSIIDIRHKYGDEFEKSYNIRLGFMSFCIKAVLIALRYFPEMNAFIDGDDIIYHDYFDFNIAISTSRGLLTPIIKNIDMMNIADIEQNIKTLAIKARDNKLKVDELASGNFTITNGGIFGSLMSTPIINPPQSAILGMHAIKKRPIALNDQIVIMPMMYLALSYDHRLIDGKESVSFLVMIKDMMEDPIRLFLDI